MKLRNALFAATALTLVSFVAAPAQANSTNDFIKKVSVSNEFEIESSKLALEKSENSQVKEFAQKMIDDHTDAGEKFASTLEEKKMAAPEDALDTKHQKVLNRLQNASGKNFDRQYIAAQTQAHKEAVSTFSGYAKHGNDKALRTFASETLPTLKEHMHTVEQLKASM